MVGANTHSLLDLAEFLELLAESGVVGVPGKAAGMGQCRVVELDEGTYPMKSLVDMVLM